MENIKEKAQGIALCIVIAIGAWMLGKAAPIVGAPVFSIGIGMIVTQFMKDKTNYAKGIKFTSKKILQYAVILLGFGMNLNVVFEMGVETLPVIISTISTSLIVAFIMYKILKVERKTSVLIGVGSCICGGSAIAATAPVIGADDEEIAQSISVIFLFNILAALIFPSLGGMLGMSNEAFGIFAGTAINDTSSVTAAATVWDGIYNSNTLEIATIVKLTRTLAIVPITMVLSVYEMRRCKKTQGQEGEFKGTYNIKSVFPFFILFFLLASLITTIATSVGVDASVFSPMKTLSKFFIVMAMGAIGLNTDIVNLVKKGGKPIIMGFVCWTSISIVSLLMDFQVLK